MILRVRRFSATAKSAAMAKAVGPLESKEMTLLSGLPSYMDWHWLWLTIAAFLAGVLNAVAGGGSFLLFPAMLGMKMLPIQANATNTVALWPGQLTSVAAYRDDSQKSRCGDSDGGCRADWRNGRRNCAPQHSADDVPAPRTWLLLVAAVIFALSGPVSRWLNTANSYEARRLDGEVHRPIMVAVFLGTIAVCFYIGYFGAGAGFLDHYAALAVRLPGSERDQCS